MIHSTLYDLQQNVNMGSYKINGKAVSFLEFINSEQVAMYKISGNRLTQIATSGLLNRSGMVEHIKKYQIELVNKFNNNL
jgi:hypothetical protein